MNPIRRVLGLKRVRTALRQVRLGERAERWHQRIASFYRNDRSGTEGGVWEPLVLFSFLLAAAFVGPASQVPALFARSDAPDTRSIALAEQAPEVDPAPTMPGPALLEVTPPSPTAAEASVDESPPARTPAAEEAERVGPPAVRDPVERPPLMVPPNADRALISWWNDERWEERDADAERWKREWLRFARRNPDDVPLELWLSVLEWAPNDRALLRSASRAASRNSPRRRRGGWLASGSGERVQASETAMVVAEIERAVRDSQRRAEYSEHRNDGPSSSWYRSLLRRLRGGG